MVRDNEPDDTIPRSDEISLFELGTSLLRHRWRIVSWMVVGASVLIATTLFGKPSYTASATFVPQTSDEGGRSGLASLAGQFGIRVGGGGDQANSPDFYADLLKSRVILAPIAADTFTVTEERKTDTLLNLLHIPPVTPDRRLDLGVARLQQLEGTTTTVKTGVIKLSVTTQWASVSRAIVQRLIAAVNAFNLRTRQSQASEERKFTETRLADARNALRESEDKLQSFLQHNRQGNSPELKFDQDRLEREVGLNQQVMTSLAQSYEEVRIREVRNTPVITVIEPPALPSSPDGRGRTVRAILGLVLGAVFAVIASLTQEFSRRRQVAGDAEAKEFFAVLGDVRNDAARIISGLRKRDA
jgi:uncharacterized protein involved in exopolysaccharide biosynthesis